MVRGSAQRQPKRGERAAARTCSGRVEWRRRWEMVLSTLRGSPGCTSRMFRGADASDQLALPNAVRYSCCRSTAGLKPQKECTPMGSMRYMTLC